MYLLFISGYTLMNGSYEHGNEPSGPMKAGN
jgi:hypothetical protein